jgi:glycerol-3-phosphate acyltransferase PlsY
LVGRWLGFEVTVVAAAGLAAVIGQMWPVFSRFDGEKGNSIAIAMAFALAYRPALVAIIPIIIALLIRTVPRLLAKSGAPGERALIGGTYSQSLPLGIALAFLLLPLAGWRLGEPPEINWGMAILFLLIMLRRLTAGLRADLATGENIGGILTRRLLYDRATAPWRRK